MLSSSTQKKPLSEVGLRQAVTRALDKGFMREAWHSEVERAPRNISDDDIRFGLERKSWTLERPPDYDEEHGSWEYLILTEDVDGYVLHLKIAVFPEENRVAVITKYRNEGHN